MHVDLSLAIAGVGTGGALALLTLGLVAIYRGSGVLNFAHGAIATMAAYVFVRFFATWHWPIILSVVVGVLAATLIGVSFQLLVMRPIADAPVLTKIVGTLGLLVALVNIIPIAFGNSLPPPLQFLPHRRLVLPLGSPKFGLGEDRLIIALVAIAAAVVLWALYRFTIFGVATRAATDNERAAILLGHSPQRLALINWALGSALAGFAGILLSTLVQLTPGFYTVLMIPVVAAALLGGFQSFGLAVAGAFAIGCGQAVLNHYDFRWQTATGIPGWSQVLPFAVIALVLILRGKSIPERSYLLNRPLPRVPQTQPIWYLPLVAAGGVAWYALMPTEWADPMTSSLIAAIVFLSFVVVVGYVGQISLVQMGFAGLGALVAAHAAANSGIPFPLPLLIGAVVAIPLGLLIGLPALRVRGINLAVITVGAAFALDQTVFSDPSLTGNDTGLVVPPPKLFGVNLNSVTHARPFGMFVLAVFVICALVVTATRRAPLGMRFLAIRANERGAAAAGVSVVGAKLVAFSLSGVIAALAGGLLAYQDLNVSFARFTALASITYLSMAYLGGITSVGGALTAGILVASGGVVSHIFGTGTFSTTWIPVLAGLGTMQIVVMQPEGLAGTNAALVRGIRKRIVKVMPYRGPAVMNTSEAQAEVGAPDSLARRAPAQPSLTLGAQVEQS
jgi:ABC-type branched-subunit amino acid transport system permease subunit